MHFASARAYLGDRGHTNLAMRNVGRCFFDRSGTICRESAANGSSARAGFNGLSCNVGTATSNHIGSRDAAWSR